MFGSVHLHQRQLKTFYTVVNQVYSKSYILILDSESRKKSKSPSNSDGTKNLKSNTHNQDDHKRKKQKKSKKSKKSKRRHKSRSPIPSDEEKRVNEIIHELFPEKGKYSQLENNFFST